LTPLVFFLSVHEAEAMKPVALEEVFKPFLKMDQQVWMETYSRNQEAVLLPNSEAFDHIIGSSFQNPFVLNTCEHPS
jgi:hypothetical protein